MGPKPDGILNAILLVSLLNFVAFISIGGLIGGDAAAGYVENGHYFVKSHGKATEVSSFVYEYSRLHVFSLFITHPLGMICAALVMLRRKAHS